MEDCVDCVGCLQVRATGQLAVLNAEFCWRYMRKTLRAKLNICRAEQEWKNKKHKCSDPDAKAAYFTLTLKPCSNYFNRRCNYIFSVALKFSLCPHLQ